MRKNYTQSGAIGNDNRIHIANDWYSLGLPPNVLLGENVFVDTSYGFAGFRSLEEEALVIGEASGCYDRSCFLTSEEGRIEVGKFTILNGTTLICQKQITIGNHCMLAWGSLITDCWLAATSFSREKRRETLKKTACDPARPYPFLGEIKPVVLEDNCWVGFDAVILPGVHLRKGCVIGCKTVVDFDVPPYAVVAGSPARIIKYLPPYNTEKVKLAMGQLYSQ